MPFRPSDVGVSRDVLRRAIARGAVVPLGCGAFLAADRYPDEPALRHGLAALAIQLRRPDLVASHRTAALVHGLPLLNTPTAGPEFTRSPRPSLRSSAAPRVVLRELPPGAVTEIRAGLLDGLRLTTPARTAVDLAADLELGAALMVTDHVARLAVRSHLTPRQLRGPLSHRARQVALRPLLAACVAPVHLRRRVSRTIDLTDPRRESAGESVSFGRLVDAGLPVPDCQRGILTEEGQVFVDFWWDDFGLAGECDGHVKYDGTFGHDPGVLVREADRHHALLATGVAVERWRADHMMFAPHRPLARLAGRLRGLGWDG